jgi:hypothetical protein
MTLTDFLHYPRMFIKATREEGVARALVASSNVIRGRGHLNRRGGLTARLSGPSPDYAEKYLPDLSAPATDRSRLILIITDLQIDQCLTYRIQQKLRFLARIGLDAIVFSSHHSGLIKSYAPLASKIIIYRTSLGKELLDELQSFPARVFFEVDDLVIGASNFRTSGVTASLPERQAANIAREAEALLNTAIEADEIIVSTERLKTEIRTALPKHARTDKIHVIKNYLNPMEVARVSKKRFDFAFTSPSGSTGPEVALVASFLKGLRRPEDTSLRLLIIGNRGAYQTLKELAPVSVDVSFYDYLPYPVYRRLLTEVRFVLAPLTANRFNECKTAIRALDALAAGALPLVSPVGEYRCFLGMAALSTLLVSDAEWSTLGDRLKGMSGRFPELLSACQNEADALYGEESADIAYRKVFSS